MHLVQIPAGEDAQGESPLKRLWPVVSPLIQKAVDHSNGNTALEIELSEIAAKRKQLWAIVTGEGKEAQIIAAGVSSIAKLHTGPIIANLELIGGESMKLWLSVLSQFEAWAVTEGCSEVRLFARKGWAKHLPDYKIQAYVMSKPIHV